MRIVNTSGTMGDSYTNCCKLISINEKMQLNHYQPYPKFDKIIGEIYSLVPNIVKINFIHEYRYIRKNNDPYPFIYSFSKNFPDESEEFKMNYFPDFKIQSKYRFNFPYIVLQPHSGRAGQGREFNLRTVKKIIKTSKYQVLLIGTDKRYEKVKGCINLINKTSLFDSFSIIKNAKYYIGFFGMLAMVALSNRVNSNFIYTNEQEMDERVYNTPWEKYSKRIVSLENYIKMHSSFLLVLKRIASKHFKKRILNFNSKYLIKSKIFNFKGVSQFKRIIYSILNRI